MKLIVPLSYVLFIMSGFAGLMYEGVWARYLKLLLGHSAYGQVLTLVVYMGGLGIGAFVASRYVSKLARPFLAFGVVEILIAFGAFIFHPLYLFTHSALFGSGILHNLSPLHATILQTIAGTAITLPWAILMGATFPLITTGLARYLGDGGRSSVPMMYFTNSIGAVAGILTMSFFFIPRFGTQGALHIAGALDLFVGVAFFILQKIVPTPIPKEGTVARFNEAPAPVNAIPLPTISGRVLIILALGTGFSSFVYEISWIRMLSLTFGSSTHTFDVMISAFILGLALGSLISRRLLRKWDAAQLLVMAQYAMPLMAAISLLVFPKLILANNWLNLVVHPTEAAYPVHTFLKYMGSAMLMCPASLFAGMTLPFLTIIAMNSKRGESSTGWIYGWNTVGCITGAALGAMILLPRLQLANTLIFGIIVDIWLGYLIHRRVPQAGRKLLALGILAVITTIFAFSNPISPSLATMGSFRGFRSANTEDRIIMRDGITATISLHWAKGGEHLSLRTNGKPDASVSLNPNRRSKDELTQVKLGLLPIATQSKPYNAAVIGLGSGITAHQLLSDSLAQSVDVIEIEREIVKLGRYFAPHNNRAYNDPRSTIIIEDALTFFARRGKKYDLVISEPSNPWVSGVSNLFTKEFYRDLSGYMTDNGVLVQWVHLYEFNDRLLFSILLAIREVFPHFQLHQVGSSTDLIILASRQPVQLNPLRINTEEQIATLNGFGLGSGGLTWAGYLGSEATVKPWLDDVVGVIANSQFHPFLDSYAEKAFFTRSFATAHRYLLPGMRSHQELLGDTLYATIRAKLDSAHLERFLADTNRLAYYRFMASRVRAAEPANLARFFHAINREIQPRILGAWLKNNEPDWLPRLLSTADSIKGPLSIWLQLQLQLARGDTLQQLRLLDSLAKYAPMDMPPPTLVREIIWAFGSQPDPRIKLLAGLIARRIPQEALLEWRLQASILHPANLPNQIHLAEDKPQSPFPFKLAPDLPGIQEPGQ